MATVIRVLSPSESAFRLPSEPMIMEVTPDMASDWLSFRNHPNNRPLSRSVTARYQADMEHEPSRWQLTPEGLIFDTDGYILSGQHRLKAVANSGKVIRFWVFPDQPRDTFGVLDSGFKRNAAQMIRQKNASTVAAAARHLAVLADQDLWGMPRYSRVSTVEVLETAQEWPELGRYSSDVFQIYLTTRIPAAAHLAVLAQAARTEHADKIPTWVDSLHSGADLSRGGSRLLLRNRFATGYAGVGPIPRKDLNYGLIVKAWNAYANDERMGLLVYRAGENFPRVDGFDWSNPKAA